MPLKFVVGPATNPPSRVTPVFSVTLMLSFSQNRSPPTPHGVGVVILTLNQLPPLLPFLAAAAAWVNIHHGYGNFLARALVAVMDRLPPSAAPRRRAPPQGRLCGRSPASSERRRGASLVAVPAGAPVSVARPRPRPKGTTAPGKPAPCGSRASPDPGRRPSTRAAPFGRGAVRVQVAHGRQPSPARPAVAGYGISPRSRCGLPEPRHCIGNAAVPSIIQSRTYQGSHHSDPAHRGRRRHSVQVGSGVTLPGTRGGFPLSP